jgi:undecaprenyl-diphosphatase
MTQPQDSLRQPVEDVLASEIEARRGGTSPWSEQLRELGAIDRAMYQAVADTPTPRLDGVFRRLSTAGRRQGAAVRRPQCGPRTAAWNQMSHS